jgi:hypothetical protein
MAVAVGVLVAVLEGARVGPAAVREDVVVRVGENRAVSVGERVVVRVGDAVTVLVFVGRKVGGLVTRVRVRLRIGLSRLVGITAIVCAT